MASTGISTALADLVPGCQCDESICTTNSDTILGVCPFSSNGQGQWVQKNSPSTLEVGFCNALDATGFNEKYGPNQTDVFGYYDNAGITYITGSGSCAQAVSQQNACYDTHAYWSSHFSVASQFGTVEVDNYPGKFNMSITSVCQSVKDKTITKPSDDRLNLFISIAPDESINRDNVQSSAPQLTSKDWIELDGSGTHGGRRHMCYEASVNGQDIYLLFISLGNPPCKGPAQNLES